MYQENLKALSLIDNKQKKWSLFTTLFFLFLSLDDYGVYTLSIPPFDQLKVNEGILKVKRETAGKGGSGGDIVSLLAKPNSFQSIDFRCRLGTRVKTACISINDTRFYDRTRTSDQSYTIKSNTFANIRHAKVWWYEANVFGPLHDKRLLQLDVEGERIITYIEQKDKYFKQKNSHMYLPTIFLAISFIVFGILQLANSSNPSFKRDSPNGAP